MRFHEHHQSLRTLIAFDVMESLIQMVAQGMGITVLPKPYIEFLQSEQLKLVKYSLSKR
ncbi:LysR substrate-binding domain-containing protein [Bacillus cereus]|uniref:LysR substrate-binding domain-containing protein n=1 Tax=Bacillus hominis TaxID=2817478 RepID=UPI0002F1A345